jgi:hypothetical protein
MASGTKVYMYQAIRPRSPAVSLRSMRSAGHGTSDAAMRLTSAENKAIEQRAVDVKRAYCDGLNYDTNDVGSTESYDIKATKDGRTLKIEVKGDNLRWVRCGFDLQRGRASPG